jgi:hypothetical protein
VVSNNDTCSAAGAGFDDSFGCFAAKRCADVDVFGFVGFGVALALDDFAREDLAFKVEDGEVVIFKLIGRRGRKAVNCPL